MPSYTSFVITLVLGWCFQVSSSEQPSLEPSWTWLGESPLMYDLLVYGEKGVLNSVNMPDGRFLAAGWYDNMKQELWLFGGFGFSGVTDIGTLFTLVIVLILG